MSSNCLNSSGPHDTIRLDNTIQHDEDELACLVTSSTMSTTLHHEDHARITPINGAAKTAFHEIALILKSNPEWNPHARQFIHVNETKTTEYTVESDSSDEESIHQIANRPMWTGYYRLNLAILPAKFANGWIIGAGRDKPTEANVDILVSINGRRDSVRTRHARIVYHRESRAPMIGALPKKSLLLNGQEIREQAHVLSKSQGIIIGHLAYRLEFLHINKAKHIQTLDMIVTRTRRWSHGNHSSFDPTPSDNHFELRGYQFQTPQAAGAYGVVSACLQISTGNLYAVKRVQRTMKSFGLINTEVTVMKKLGKHPHICDLVETFYSDGDGLSMGNKSVNDVYMILDPWAPQSIADLAASHTAAKQLTLAYHQGAQGIRHLHRSGIIHRDIKPANLLVSNLYPLRVVVADFGHATFAPDANDSTKKRKHDLQDHMKGTVSYLPPEIMALKDGTDMSGCWSKASDVFTYGVVGFELFHGNFRRSRAKHSIDAPVHKFICSELRAEVAMDEVLASMLRWKLSDRPTIDQILLKSVWANDETVSSTTKRKIAPDS